MENETNKIYFPVNVNASYHLIAGLGWKEIRRYVLPEMIVMIGFWCIPPYNSILFWVIKFIVLVVYAIAAVVMIFCKPVYTRPNITMESWLKARRNYKNRQKVFYISKKERKLYENESFNSR